jgi:hypothetical protein
VAGIEGTYIIIMLTNKKNKKSLTMFFIYDIIKITKVNVLSFSKKNVYIFLEKY